ncbi:MAG: pantetheine-phosphate adenylyltransferase [Actinobacteria bacterium]|nr:pantetheine-phosphate adenylyltransferase [Actinomycetota bacterium]
MKTALCPGTYDPVTNGHLDIISRAADKFDKVVVAVVKNPPRKQLLFSLEERLQFLREATKDLPNVLVAVLDGLVVDCARKHGADALVKGLRAVMDFEYEFQMAQLNKVLAPELETIYFMASAGVGYVSSSGVKEIAMFGGGVDGLVPDMVAKRFAEIYRSLEA